MIQLGEHKVRINRYINPKNEHITVANLYDKSNTLLSVAQVTCSTKDCYDKKKGRKLAISRAISKTRIPDDIRRNIWEAYRKNMTKKPRWITDEDKI